MEPNLPKNLLEKSSLRSLPAKEKEEYLKNLLKRVLDLNPDGVTVPQLKNSLGLSPSTIWHHLEILKSTGQSRKISRGNLDIYYSFGSKTPIKELIHAKSKAQFIIGTLSNSEGKFVGIHERRQNRLGSYTVVRGIAIPFELLDDFIEELSKVNESREK